MTGIAYSDGDIIVVLDADLQHPPEIIPALIEKIKQGHDIAIASRYIDDANVKRWSAFRMLMSRAAILLCHILFPRTRKVKDPVSGFFAVKKEVLQGIKFYSAGYKVLLEILVRGKYERVAEMPYDFRERKKGKSKLNLNIVVSYIASLILIKLATPSDKPSDAYQICDTSGGKKD